VTQTVKHAIALGCEGIVSKRRGSVYMSGHSRHTLLSICRKVTSPTFTRCDLSTRSGV
jgi:hypothetical protein